MGFFDNLFSKKETIITTNPEFWQWFQQHANAFYKITQAGEDIHDFHNLLSAKLNELREGYFFLSGMYDDDTAELVITADGHIKNFVFVEELIASAPQIKGWRFTALKPAMDIHTHGIKMDGFDFSEETLSFYPNEDENHPDEIDITVVHNDFTEDNKDSIILGTHIFLDNYLGEINFATTIDAISVLPRQHAQKELIPIERLKAYLIWREKEFVEKYEGIRHNTENDGYTTFEGSLENGNTVVAVINTTLLTWDCVASHPWIARIEIGFDGSESGGLPHQNDFSALNNFEDSLLDLLKDSDGYLNVGRETGDNTRTIYFACNDFRKPSKVIDALSRQYHGVWDISHSIYKDKYWQTFSRFCL